MIASVLARFDVMSASAIKSCISVPVATGIGDDTAVYLFCAQSGTFVPLLNVPRFTTLIRGSLVYDAWRYRAPTDDDGTCPVLLSWNTRFCRRVLLFDAVTFQTNAAGTSTASARAAAMLPLSWLARARPTSAKKRTLSAATPPTPCAVVIAAENRAIAESSAWARVIFVPH